MPLRPPTPCSYRGHPPCPVLVYGGGGRCPEHVVFGRRAVDKSRRERTPDLYGPTHRRRFRPAVLRKDPYCRCDLADHAPHYGAPCSAPSTDADHWPMDKRALIMAGLDSDDPQYGRGLCRSCHSASTARLQPGGWNQRTR